MPVYFSLLPLEIRFPESLCHQASLCVTCNLPISLPCQLPQLILKRKEEKGLVEAVLIGLNILTGYFPDLKQVLSKHKNRIFLFHLSLFSRTTEWGICQTPWLVYLCKKKFFLNLLHWVLLLFPSLVLKMQCANPNIKPMLYNNPPLPSLTRRADSSENVSELSTRNASVQGWTTHLLSPPGGSTVGSSAVIELPGPALRHSILSCCLQCWHFISVPGQASCAQMFHQESIAYLCLISHSGLEPELCSHSLSYKTLLYKSFEPKGSPVST